MGSKKGSIQQDDRRCSQEKMIIEAQRLGVTYAKGENEVGASNFHEIGRAWKKIPFKVGRAGQLN